jgi:hypothetical protein
LFGSNFITFYLNYYYFIIDVTIKFNKNNKYLIKKLIEPLTEDKYFEFLLFIMNEYIYIMFITIKKNINIVC